MTQAEPLNAGPSTAPTYERAVETIEVDELDKENLGWTRGYVNGLKDRLAAEQAAETPDFVMISYIKNEIAAYQDLLDRTAKS
jgi:hypothetical protein